MNGHQKIGFNPRLDVAKIRIKVEVKILIPQNVYADHNKFILKQRPLDCHQCHTKQAEQP